MEQPFRVPKRQFSYVKIRYPDLNKNTAQLSALFTLSNFLMMRSKLMRVGT